MKATRRVPRLFVRPHCSCLALGCHRLEEFRAPEHRRRPRLRRQGPPARGRPLRRRHDLGTGRAAVESQEAGLGRVARRRRIQPRRKRGRPPPLSVLDEAKALARRLHQAAVGAALCESGLRGPSGGTLGPARRGGRIDGQAASSTVTTRRFLKRARASSSLPILVAWRGSSMRRTSLSWTPMAAAKALLDSPWSRRAS